MHDSIKQVVNVDGRGDRPELVPIYPQGTRATFTTTMAQHLGQWVPGIEVDSSFEQTVDAIFGDLLIDPATGAVASPT